MAPTAPDRDELLRLYDREQREYVVYPGMRREEALAVVRHVSLRADRGTVVFTRLDATTAEEAISAQIAYFESIGQDFEWKLYEHDRPSDLRARLESRGFEVEEPETIMILDLETAAQSAFEHAATDVRPILDTAGIDDVAALLENVWGTDHASLGSRLAMELREYPDYLSIYGSYEGGTLASAAWINFHEGSRFASLWGGSTRAECRGRGHYTALLAVRAGQARRRGARFLTVDAGAMSQPILEGRGFHPVAVARACQWRVRDRVDCVTRI
jgi:GNAT superfamily N-acetyltransferase